MLDGASNNTFEGKLRSTHCATALHGDYVLQLQRRPSLMLPCERSTRPRVWTLRCRCVYRPKFPIRGAFEPVFAKVPLTDRWSIIVLDTNILLEFLDIIQTFVSEAEQQRVPVLIIIPGAVIHELDAWVARIIRYINGN